jgi:hypothetical protein
MSTAPPLFSSITDVGMPGDVSVTKDRGSSCNLEELEKENQDLRKENEDLRLENTRLAREIESLRATNRPLRASMPAPWASTSPYSPDDKPFMRPTRASQLRKAAAARQKANTHPPGHPHGSVSPANHAQWKHLPARPHPGNHHHQNNNTNNDWPPSAPPSYMQHTASSAQRKGTHQPAPTDARARMLQHTKQTARTRKALARLDDSLWRTMQERTEQQQPVARPIVGGGQAPPPPGQWPLTTGGQLQLSLPIRPAGAAEPRTGSTTTTATTTAGSPTTASPDESEMMV